MPWSMHEHPSCDKQNMSGCNSCMHACMHATGSISINTQSFSLRSTIQVPSSDRNSMSSGSHFPFRMPRRGYQRSLEVRGTLSNILLLLIKGCWLIEIEWIIFFLPKLATFRPPSRAQGQRGPRNRTEGRHGCSPY